MPFVSSREKRLWSLAGLLVVLTYSTLSVTRPLTEYLREHNLLRLVMVLVIALVVGWTLRGLRRSWPNRWEWLVLGCVALVYGALFRTLTGPEEAMHFVQYGVLGGLVHTALVERIRFVGTEGSSAREGLLVAGLLAALLTLAAGWVDEGIQYLLPSRIYDLRDVGFNAAAGALAVAALVGRAWARGTALR